ncbi:MAG: DUF3854 domain-containing protein [Candidatus Ratteibacteria bacterium]|jgi:hypothetical protein
MENIFHPEHLADLKKSGLTDNTIEQAGIKTVLPAKINKKLGFDISALTSMYEIPYDDKFSRFKPFYDNENGKKKQPKYLQRKDTGNRLYIPTLVKSVLQDISYPIYIAEGEKKALKANQEGLYCIGLPGLWNWSDGNKKLISDFNLLALDGRTIYIVPDNDWEQPDKHGYKKNLKQAVNELSGKLKERGARVSVLLLPSDGNKIGLDDYLCAHSAQELQALPLEEITSPKDGKETTQSDKLLELIQPATLFHDDLKEPLVLLRVDDHNEIWRVSGKPFRRLMSKRAYEKLGKVPNSEVMRSTINVIEGQAVFSASRYTLHNRVARQENTIWYDLTNYAWQAVKITPEGWEAIDAPPILFKRHTHQMAQVLPVKGGDVKQVLRFVNLKPKQDLLFVVYLISCFLPDIPHPIPVLYGEKGSAKTTTFKLIKKLVDPSAVETLTFPRDLNELVQQISHHWWAGFDNVSALPEWVSDALCRAVTGEGFSKRQLYSDDEDVVYSFKRCVGLNGINVAATREDLLDRSIIFGLEEISKDKRKEEAVFWAEFEEARPNILGGVFDVLSRAISIYPTINLPNLHRMADFTRWGCAIAEAIGDSGNKFLDQYGASIKAQNEEAIQANPVAAAVIIFMAGNQEWTGKASELMDQLNKTAESERFDTHSKFWPKAAHALTRRLNRAKATLRDAGVEYINRGHQETGTLITLRKIPSEASVSSNVYSKPLFG